MAIDDILKYFEETIPEIHRKFDFIHEREKRNMATYVTKIEAILGNILNNPKQDTVSTIEFNIAMLLWRGVNTIFSAFELVRGGYGIEPLIILRNAVETFAAAIDLKNNPGKYELFRKNKYKSHRAITEASKVIPIYGKLYGILSNSYAHVTFSSSYVQHFKNAEGITHLIRGGMFGEENKYYLLSNLAIIESTLAICLAITEYIFFNYCDKSEFWGKSKSGLVLIWPKEEYIKYISRINLMLSALVSIKR